MYGDVRTAKLKIADGVVFEGKCEMIKDQSVDVFSAKTSELKEQVRARSSAKQEARPVNRRLVRFRAVLPFGLERLEATFRLPGPPGVGIVGDDPLVQFPGVLEIRLQFLELRRFVQFLGFPVGATRYKGDEKQA